LEKQDIYRAGYVHGYSDVLAGLSVDASSNSWQGGNASERKIYDHGYANGHFDASERLQPKMT